MFSYNGVTGQVMFTQNSSSSPTLINVTLQGLDRHQGGQYPWHVHQYPFAAALGDPCGPSHAGGHYDPLGAIGNPNYATECSTTSRHLCEVGDLSGKFGLLNSSGTLFAEDDTLSLYGVQSIMGRSLVIHYNDTRYTCANIPYPDNYGVVRYAPFRQGAIVGDIYLHQYGGSATLVYADLLSTAMSLGHNWHVHENLVSGGDSSCTSAGGHYNPRNVTIDSDYHSLCNSSAPSQCELGDLTGKSGQLNFVDNRARLLYTDTDLPIAPNDNGFSINNRSIVIHGPNATATRAACANVLSLKPREAIATFTGEVTGTIRFFQRSPFEATIINVSLEGLGKKAGGYHVHKTPIGVGPDQCMDQYTGGHWNPLGVQYGGPAPSTSDQYEVGDLSGKFGSLEGLETINDSYTDMNIPLYRRNSIVGRSIVIHYANASRWVCANIEYMTPTASASTVFTVNGHRIKMVLTQLSDDPFADTTITIVTVPPNQPSVTSSTTPIATPTTTAMASMLSTNFESSMIVPSTMLSSSSIISTVSTSTSLFYSSSSASASELYMSPSPSINDTGSGEDMDVQKRDIEYEFESLDDLQQVALEGDDDVSKDRVRIERQNDQPAMIQWSIRAMTSGSVGGSCGALEQFLPAGAEL